MEQVESIPFSVLIAGMLLCKKSYNSADIVNMISELEDQGIVIDDENDNMDELFCCVEMGSNYDFRLREGLGYDTVLYPNVTVSKFLEIHTNEKMLSFLNSRLNHSLSDFEVGYECSDMQVDDTNIGRHRRIFGEKKKRLVKRKAFINKVSCQEVNDIDWSAILG